MDNESTDDGLLSWEEQEEAIRRLNSKCIKFAGDIIDGTDMEIKYTTKDGDPVYTTKADGLDMLARCSSIAKQWTAERRQSKPKEDGEDVAKISTEDLMKEVNK